MIKQYKLRFYNFRLVVFLLAISFIGIHLVGTAADYLRTRQLLGVIIGVVFMLLLSLMDYSWLLNFQWIMYGFNIVMLLAVRFFGSSANGAARWVDLGFIRFQPTELSKIIIILFFAKFFMDHEDDLNTLKTLAQSAVLLVIPLMLIYVQPDMKNTVLYSDLYCRTQLQNYRRSGSDCNSSCNYFSVDCCTAGSETDSGLSEKPYYVVPVSGERRICG